MGSLHHISLLTAAESEDLSAQINQLRDYWVSRDAFGLHTLGAAAYLDAPTQATLDEFGVAAPAQDAYQRYLEQFNPILETTFAALYERLRAALSGCLQADVQFSCDKAMPGFHIFNYHPKYGQPGAHVPHYDRQYECLSWSQAVTPDDAQTLSFTLPVKLPACGGGLKIWDIYLQDILGIPKADAKDKIKRARAWRESYTPGLLVCHPGHQLHQIAPWSALPGEQRITLQGHALLQNGCWQLYW